MGESSAMEGGWLHVVCGDSAAASLRASGAVDPGTVRVQHDVLSVGPLLPFEDLGTWRRTRHAFWREVWPEAPEFLKQMSAHLIVVPSKTPPEIVTKLNAAINRAVADATMRDRLDKSGLFPRAPMSVDEVSVYVRGQVAEWTSTFTSTGIRDAVRATAN